MARKMARKNASTMARKMARKNASKMARKSDFLETVESRRLFADMN
jgi:hypothetical protein